jgi:Tol biopolymer transport system component
VLLNTPAGAWVVHDDGSKRLLTGYADAAWSPHGLYVAAARGNDLVALEPNGRVHWKLAKAEPIGSPQWSYEGYRIAYLAGHALRIVNGDGTGDHLLSPNAVGAELPAYAWRPGTHELAYKNARNEVLLADVDRSRILWRRKTTGVERLDWSDDGRRLFIDGGPTPVVVDARGITFARIPEARGVDAAAFVPHSEALTVATTTRGRSAVLLFTGSAYQVRRQLFSGIGVFAGLAWAPNGRWLLVDWASADQWVLVRIAPTPRVRTISNIDATFGTRPEHSGALAGWCCG